MVFVAGGFVDEVFGVGRGGIGSSQLADGAVYRAKLGRSAVGSGQHGTISLTKASGIMDGIYIP